MEVSLKYLYFRPNDHGSFFYFRLICHFWLGDF